MDMDKPIYEDIFNRLKDLPDEWSELDAFLLALKVTNQKHEVYDSYDDMQVPDEERPVYNPYLSWDTVVCFDGSKENQTDHQFFFEGGKYLGSAKLVW
jgi:hypothetical protein